ncbi:MAG TPA: hypothetical protein DCW60_02115 [Sutterella sp.]|nr:hypothetical protein [Sutterella sp.]
MSKKISRENQIHEIIRAARCSVFFIDERQRVTLLDKGSISEIKKFAKLEGCEITKQLPAQAGRFPWNKH